MITPLLVEQYQASEYIHLFRDDDGMNYYSAKIDDNEFVMVDDYDTEIDYTKVSDIHISFLDKDRFLYKQNGKYGIVNLEGWIIVPFVYSVFNSRTGKIGENLYDVCLNNRWGVINCDGKEVYKIRYKSPIVINGYYNIVEDADTNCKGIIRYDGLEVVPAIYSQIEEVDVKCGKDKYEKFFFVAYGTLEEVEEGCFIKGIWGCYNHKGQEIISVRHHSIHVVGDYLIVGKDEYVEESDNIYIGTYDLYDKEGNLIIGGFSHISVFEQYFIIDFGIIVKSYWKPDYWGEIHYNDELQYDILWDKKVSVIVDKELKSLIPSHIVEETQDEIEYEYDFLMNSIPHGEGYLVGEYQSLTKGMRYSSDDKIIKRMCVSDAYSDGGNVIKYFPYKRNTDMSEEFQLFGMVFTKERKVTEPIYRSIKIINENFVFIQNKEGLVGIRNAEKELIKPQFNLITNPYNNIAVGFEITRICNCVESKEDCRWEYECGCCEYSCKCVLLRFCDNEIRQEEVSTINGSELYNLLYCRDNNSLLTYLENEEKDYWTNIPCNNDSECFWFPLDKDFRYLLTQGQDNEEFDYDEEDSCTNNTDDIGDDNWSYYNDNLDMDQQSPDFWNF